MAGMMHDDQIQLLLGISSLVIEDIQKGLLRYTSVIGFYAQPIFHKLPSNSNSE